MSMTILERTAYEKWREARAPYRDGTALMNAYLDGRRDMLAEHIEVCHRGCDWCTEHRAWGTCTTCGGDTEAVGAFESSRCCGSPVALNERELEAHASHRALIVQEAAARSAEIIDREDAWSAS